MIERTTGPLGMMLRGMTLAARWLMALIYIGLLGAMLLLVEKFAQKLVETLPHILTMSGSDTILTVLTLVDLALVGNLVLIVIFSGWEMFVGRMLSAVPSDQPNWLTELDFSAVKLKLIGSVAAIAAIQILETFVHMDQTPKEDAAWQLGILLGIGITGVLLALMDKLSGGGH